MTNERYHQIESDPDAKLTQEEMDEGWHFCMEFDALLVKGDPNEEFCGKACIDWDGSL